MTRGPWVISKTSKPFGRDAEMYDSSFGWRFINPKLDEVYGTESMGQTAENVAEKYNINRQDQDAFACGSQKKASAAQTGGRFKIEIVAIEIPQRKSDPIQFDADEFIRPQTTAKVLATLKPAFKKEGTVTAGNSSGLNDGTAAILIASEEGVNNHGLKPMARIVASAVVGVEPRKMGIGPVQATNNALEKAGLKMDDIDIIELNEAFAAQSLACIRQWGLNDDDIRINPNGGAIALGHPLGMSGTRIIQTAAIELKKQGKKYALATMCVGVGQGYAVIIENIN
jgi:acetyl-CoA acetyltransferase family protein